MAAAPSLLVYIGMCAGFLSAPGNLIRSGERMVENPREAPGTNEARGFSRRRGIRVTRALLFVRVSLGIDPGRWYDDAGGLIHRSLLKEYNCSLESSILLEYTEWNYVTTFANSVWTSRQNHT